jgi:hypothetical protein
MIKRFAMCALIAVAGNVSAITKKFQSYTFESSIVGDQSGLYQDVRKNTAHYIRVLKDEEYSIIISNPLPVRVAVAVTIDGLNVIDGKRSSPDNAQKWIIDANASLTLRGWQTDRSSLRRFVFTDKGQSYAQWKSGQDNRSYTQNLGVIGIAFFWNDAELQSALHPPKPFTYGECNKKYRSSAKDDAPAATPAPQMSKSAEASEERAGTGMGSREDNSVIDVEFHYNAGMYNTQDVLVVYYEFARNIEKPLPFVDEHEKEKFSPEMP